MIRKLPSDITVQVLPMPRDFAPTFEDHGRYLRWAATVEIEGHGSVALELGYHNHPTRKHSATAGPNHLRAAAWQATELARLGRMDLLGHALVRRHHGRR